MARYLVKQRRIAIDFRLQKGANFVDGYSDTDSAGCQGHQEIHHWRMHDDWNTHPQDVVQHASCCCSEFW